MLAFHLCGLGGHARLEVLWQRDRAGGKRHGPPGTKEIVATSRKEVSASWEDEAWTHLQPRYDISRGSGRPVARKGALADGAGGQTGSKPRSGKITVSCPCVGSRREPLVLARERLSRARPLSDQKDMLVGEGRTFDSEAALRCKVEEEASNETVGSDRRSKDLAGCHHHLCFHCAGQDSGGTQSPADRISDVEIVRPKDLRR